MRLLELRGLLVGLSEMGLSERICREFDVGRDDLEMLAWIEAELRELRPPKDKGYGGS